MMAEPATKRRRISSEAKERVPGFARWNLEQEYEQRPRKDKKKQSEKLLVKTEEGWQDNQRHTAEKPKEEDKDSCLASDDEAEKASGIADLGANPAAPKQPALPPNEQIRQAKEDLARIAGNISENPEENVGQLGQLQEMAASENATVKKLALGTQLAVLKDVIPGYRIRPLGKDDLQGKISKEVKKLRTFEQTLLAGYKEYAKTLEKLAGDKEFSGVAVACATSLMTNVPHFNCRNEIIAIVVKKLGSRKVDKDVEKCVQALERLFQEDEEGHASLEAVGQLTKMMKSRNYQVHERVLNTFLHLRLLSEFAHKASTNRVDKDEDEEAGGKGRKMKKKDREYRSKKERKLAKERKQVEKQMKEADAVVSYEERDKNQAETLKLVFVAYFRILKARVQHLMGAVLEGLAKYAHLINQDFFGDVLEALKDLINDAEASLQPSDETEDEDDDDTSAQRNATREALLCIITAFALLQGQIDVAKSANTLHLDLNFFTTHLYRTLLPLSLNPDIELSAKKPTHLADPNGLPLPSTNTPSSSAKVNIATTTVLLLRSLQSILLPPVGTKSVPPVRVAAFTHQLLSMSLHLPPKSARAVLALLQQVAKTHGSKIAALWHTEERKGDGVFNALSEEVESSNPFAATAWEGELLRLHWDPEVREGYKGVESNIVSSRG
jgi:nucleolar complex protein 3